MHPTDGYDNGRANTDSSGPPSNQSTPSFSPASRGWLSGRSLDKSGRSLDNSLASLADDDSLGIPAASEGELADESSAAIEKELSALEAEVSQKNVELKEWQMKELLEVREKQFQLEGTKKLDHFKQAQQKLKDTATDCQAVQLKKLKEICEKEKKELQKILDRKRQNSISEAKSRDRQKAEIQRLCFLFIEYADALANPIKHVNLLDQREKQLAALMGEIQRDDLIASILTDVQPQSIEDLRQQKGFLKLQRKQYKELKELKRKHMKKISKMNKEQNARINQMTSESKRRKSQVEKNLKRSIKKNADESSAAIEKELSALEAEVSQKNVELKEWQMKELLEVREKQFQLEGTKKLDHFKQAQQKLKDTATDCQAVQLKKLKEICEKEKKELQKILDRKRQNSISEAKSRDRQKAEIELNEINRKHINESVTLIRRLDEAQKKRHDKLLLQHKDILQQIGEEQPLVEEQSAYLTGLHSKVGGGFVEDVVPPVESELLSFMMPDLGREAGCHMSHCKPPVFSAGRTGCGRCNQELPLFQAIAFQSSYSRWCSVLLYCIND
ncbi:1-phosphatidylinositol 4,5-bisphosphate phosphodiesterase beta-3 [Acipenser ruthenus]|uniref:1-phosphatidylinositol 4,5-bisphosphate phosphodiesterase beta-3 n=1 Tax=Acipenser ruthenus TaxID=7906 RepID=A0A444V2F1_ACIRT|nr:1-phosphatidylinositol 4,5-bisphosphate phosphodiesterase beta-3 [Acipenser ruthenus]